MKKSKLALAAAAGLLLAGTTGFAAEPQGWKFELMPYAWLAGLSGDVTINGEKTEFDKSASDLLKAVELGGSLFGTVQYNRFVVWGQVDYFSLSTDELDVEDQPQGGKLESKMLIGEVAAGYQIDGWSEGQTFDIMLGVRALNMKTDLTVYAQGNATMSNEQTVVDPMLVVRPSLPVFPSLIKDLRFNPTLAIGGGGDSDLVYELFPELQYNITETLSARLGYRTVGYKFKGTHNEDNEKNIKLAGLVAGIGVTF
jgi:hypothetical protein